MPSPPVAPVQKPSARGLAASGIVEALSENTSIGVPLAALVKRVNVKVWDKVEAGAPLLELDDRELAAKLRADKAELAVQEAHLTRAQRQSARTDALRTARIIAEEDADNRSLELAIQKARVESARSAIALTETLRERLIIRAPIAGTVLQMNTRAGEYIMPGGNTPPILLGAIDEVQVRADVDEQIAPRIRPGSPAVGYLKGDNRNPIPLEFLRIEPYVVAKRNLTGSSAERVDTRVLQIIYKFPNDLHRRIYAGQQMDLFIEP